MNSQNPSKQDESFRDSIATVTKEGKRIWVYPKKPKGKFYNARNIVTIILLSILFGLPFIKVNGNPFVLLNILERKFILFGLVDDIKSNIVADVHIQGDLKTLISF